MKNELTMILNSNHFHFVSGPIFVCYISFRANDLHGKLENDYVSRDTRHARIIIINKYRYE